MTEPNPTEAPPTPPTVTLHVVTGAYVTVPVPGGKYPTSEFYRGVILPENVDQADLDRLIDTGCVAAVTIPVRPTQTQEGTR